MTDIIAAKAKENQVIRKGEQPGTTLTTLSNLQPINTRAEISKKSGVSEGTIAKIETIQQRATAKVLEIPLPAPCDLPTHSLIARPVPS